MVIERKEVNERNEKGHVGKKMGREGKRTVRVCTRFVGRKQEDKIRE